jgi:peptide/nickel transport system substrate-binding protein
MKRDRRVLAAAAGLLGGLLTAETGLAQNAGGVLSIYHRDSPASMSIHEEATISTVAPMMAVFNNLVIYDQHVPQNSLQSIVPELATSWSWSEDGTQLHLRLREGVKWHDGKPFSANDVKSTWDMLLGRSNEKLRTNPRKTWYQNIAEVTTDGDYAATFQLKRPQPAFPALLASGFSPVYPCHISPRDMRSRPIGTGPFKFVEFCQTSRSGWREIPTTGNRGDLISTVSNILSSRTGRRRSSRSSPASST